MLSFLRLNAVRLDQLILRSHADAPARSGEETYSFTLSHHDLTPITTGGDRVMQLRVRLRPDADSQTLPALDHLEVWLTGYFEFAENASEEIKSKIYPVTAVAMLFGIARGIVAQATGLFPTGTFLLPPLDVTSAKKRKRLTGTCTLVPATARSDQRTAAVSERKGKKSAIPS